MWSTQDGDAGIHPVIFYVYDERGGYDVDTVAIQVMDNAPQISDIPDTSLTVPDTLMLDLDQFVSDCNDRLDVLQWNVTGNTHLAVDIGDDRLARLFSPDGWTGTELVTFIVHDPDENVSSEECLIMVSLCPGGVLGDVDANGAINVLDVVTAINHLLNIQELDTDGRCRADCNGDTILNVLDVLGIVNVILGIFPECPGETVGIEIHPEAMGFLESLRPYFSLPEFERFMTMLKEVRIPEALAQSRNLASSFSSSPDPDIKKTIDTL